MFSPFHHHFTILFPRFASTWRTFYWPPIHWPFPSDVDKARHPAATCEETQRSLAGHVLLVKKLIQIAGDCWDMLRLLGALNQIESNWLISCQDCGRDSDMVSCIYSDILGVIANSVVKSLSIPSTHRAVAFLWSEKIVPGRMQNTRWLKQTTILYTHVCIYIYIMYIDR